MSGFFVKPCGAGDDVTVKANTPIDGDGSSNKPLEINTPALAGLLVDGKTTTVVNGKIVSMGGGGSVINNTVAAATDSTINGDGTQAQPLSVNLAALVDGNTVQVQGGKLRAVQQPATATTTDATLTGNGSTAAPLSVNPAALVDGNTTTVQGGKIKVNFPEDLQGITDAELQGSNIVFKNAKNVAVRTLNIGNLIPAAAADRFLKGVRYDQAGQKFVFTVGDSAGTNNDQTLDVPASDLIPVTVGNGIAGKGTAAEPLTVRHDNTLTIKNGQLSVVPAAEKDCVAVTNIDTFGRDSKKGFECFIADYRTTIGLPMDFPSTESEQEATTQFYPDRRNIYSGYKIGTADGSIVFVYENTADGRAIGWSRTYQGTTASKWVRETALIPPTGGGIAAVNASAPLTGAGTTGSPLALDKNTLAADLADGKTIQAKSGKLSSVVGAKVGAQVTGIGQAADAVGIYLGNNLYAIEGNIQAKNFAKYGNVPAVVTGGQGSEKGYVTQSFADIAMPSLGLIIDNQQGYEVSSIEVTPAATYYSGTQPDGITNPRYPVSAIHLKDDNAVFNAETKMATVYALGLPDGQESQFAVDLKYRALVRVPETAPYGVHKTETVQPGGNQGGGVVQPPPPPSVQPPQNGDKPQAEVASADTTFRFVSAAVGKEWAVSDDGKVVISTDDSIARKGDNWTGLVVDTDKGKAVRTQVKDEANSYIGVYADIDKFNVTADKNVTITVPFRIDGIGVRGTQNLMTVLNGNDTTAGIGGLIVIHQKETDDFTIPTTSFTGRTINGKQVDATTRLAKNKWYIGQFEITKQAFTALRLGAPAGGNGGISATFGSGLRVTENMDVGEKQQYLQQLAAQYGIELQA